jgi:serine/threonine-protein kinase ATR
VARKAKHQQTAYSGLLQAKQVDAQFSFIENAKFVQSLGQPLRAVQELEKSMKLLGMLDDSQDSVERTEVDEGKDLTAKVRISIFTKCYRS